MLLCMQEVSLNFKTASCVFVHIGEDKAGEKAWIAAIITKPQTIRVGNLATIPVCRYSTNTGIKKAAAIRVRSAASIPKKTKGL